MPEEKPPRAVDCHAHVFSTSAPSAPQAWYRPAYAAKVATWRALWRAAGVTHGVLVQPSFFGTDNAELLAALATDREHLRGVAIVDPSWGAHALRGLHEAGVRALRLNLRAEADYAPYASDEWRALYARAHALGWHVELYLRPGALGEMEPAFAGTPIPIVLDHFGNPGAEEALAERTFEAAARIASSRPLWVKLSGPYRLGGADRATLAARWGGIAGAGHLVWGSDWPWTNYENRNDYRRLREDLDRWVGAERSGPILWDNAARLYGFA